MVSFSILSPSTTGLNSSIQVLVIVRANSRQSKSLESNIQWKSWWYFVQLIPRTLVFERLLCVALSVHPHSIFWRIAMLDQLWKHVRLLRSGRQKRVLCLHVSTCPQLLVCYLQFVGRIWICLADHHALAHRYLTHRLIKFSISQIPFLSKTATYPAIDLL